MSSVRATRYAPALLHFEIFVGRCLGKQHEMNQILRKTSANDKFRTSLQIFHTRKNFKDCHLKFENSTIL